MERVILHCDLNAFYASVELLQHPDLLQKPVAVCGDPALRHGVVLAKNEPAKRSGVKTGETIWQAKRKCPDLTLLSAHHDTYRYYSKLVKSIYCRYTDLVEPFGVDEAWLDMTGSLHLFGGDAAAFADRLRAEVRETIGLTISVGVSFNKVFAKLGSDYRKPDATTVITQENFKEIVWPLPVTALLFVGRASGELLSAHGIHTIGALAAAPKELLLRLLGKNGERLHDYATGIDRTPVRPVGEEPPPKSVGNGLTFPRNLVGETEIRAGVQLLSERVAIRLRHHAMKATTIQVAIRSPEFQTISRQKKLNAPTYVSREIYQTAMELLALSWRVTSPIRAMTITATGLIPEGEAGEQLSLFAPQETEKRERQEKLEYTLDALRRKYGTEVIGFASGKTPTARALVEAEDGKEETL